MENLELMDRFFDLRADLYDTYHPCGIDGGIQSKQAVASFLPDKVKTLLDIGIGTGLELENIYIRFPEVNITGIDMSHMMLEKLKLKYPKKKMQLYCADYLKFDFGHSCFDSVISVMTLHHYSHDVKTDLYRKIRHSLKPGGVYVECDYMLSEKESPDPQGQEDFFFAEYKRLVEEQQLSPGEYYHYDTPCTVDNQKSMLISAGFSSVKEVWCKKNTVILFAEA